ncbi:YcnI family protein [Sinomonas sp. ASV322]|uniref:YcnI family copper-binding membrane protein n=1 Tax=Sinomonas sp. ASV322 TaxID=3041920 RepID=UPI0027DD1F5F|nr:YcnI family protein [Sinomonas sp. ASV322]MDQ4503942.1 YcnI family protein [Sinomonas sp. ASV322]
MNTNFRRTLTSLGTAAATAALIAAGAAAANAHVTVSPDDTGADGYSHLTFNMPNESETAETTKLEVKLPTDTPFTSVSVRPVEGWTAQVITGELPKPVTVGGSTVTKAPIEVVWTANDAAHQIGQNQYQSFSLSVGRLPAAGTKVVLAATQTYTDGMVVEWNETAEEGQPEPKHPAPAFTTTAADEAAPAMATATASASPSAGAAKANSAAPAAQTTDVAGGWGVVLGAIGAVLGATALGLVLTRRGKTAK